MPRSQLGSCSIFEALYSGTWSKRCVTYASGTQVTIITQDGTIVQINEMAAFSACTLVCNNCRTIAWVTASNFPLAMVSSNDAGGEIIIFANLFGSVLNPVQVTDPSENAALNTPYPLVTHVRALVDDALTQRALFDVPGMTWTACRLPNLISEPVSSSTQYTILVSNPTQAQSPLFIIPRFGSLTALEELTGAVPTSLYTALGYVPDGSEGVDLGNSTTTTIAGLDTRIFRVSIANDNTTLLPVSVPPRRPSGLGVNLRLPPTSSLQNLFPSSPSLPQIFDTVIVESTYISQRIVETLKDDARAYAQVGVTVVVDFTTAENLFPNLRLCNNSEPEFSNSLEVITNVFIKMASLSWEHVIFSLHRTPENNMDPDTAVASMGATLRLLISISTPLNLTLHLRNAPKNPNGLSSAISMLAWLEAEKLVPAVRFFVNLADLLDAGEDLPALETVLKYAANTPDKKMFVGVSCRGKDIMGVTYTTTSLLTDGICPDLDNVQKLLRFACSVGSCLSGQSTLNSFPIILLADAYTWGGGVNDLSTAYSEASWIVNASM